MNDPIVWLDLETDGTARENGITLEVGLVITDGLDKHVDELTVVVHPGNPEVVWDRMPQVVKDMHTVNGLWAACLKSDTDELMAEYQVMSFLDSYGLPCRPMMRGEKNLTWGGKGVSHFDGPWLETRMPYLFSCLRYWTFDVSPIRRIGALVGLEEPEFFEPGEQPHRATDDARNAWRAARWWRDVLYASKNPGQLPRMEKQVKPAVRMKTGDRTANETGLGSS